MWLACEESLKSDSQDQFAVASLSAPLAAREGVEGECRGEFNSFGRFLEPVGTPATLWHSRLIFYDLCIGSHRLPVSYVVICEGWQT